MISAFFQQNENLGGVVEEFLDISFLQEMILINHLMRKLQGKTELINLERNCYFLIVILPSCTLFASILITNLNYFKCHINLRFVVKAKFEEQLLTHSATVNQCHCASQKMQKFKQPRMQKRPPFKQIFQALSQSYVSGVVNILAPGNDFVLWDWLQALRTISFLLNVSTDFLAYNIDLYRHVLNNDSTISACANTSWFIYCCRSNTMFVVT